MYSLKPIHMNNNKKKSFKISSNKQKPLNKNFMKKTKCSPINFVRKLYII